MSEKALRSLLEDLSSSIYLPAQIHVFAFFFLSHRVVCLAIAQELRSRLVFFF